MVERALLDHQSIPVLARHAKLRFNEPRRQWVILAPERLLEPDDTSVKILQLCDGTRRISDIVTELALVFTDADPDRMGSDIIALLQNLADKGFLQDKKDNRDD